jgi:hypothetical protein
MFYDHTQTHLTRDQPVAETSTLQHNTRKRQTSMPPAGFEPTIQAGERPQTHAAIGIGSCEIRYIKFSVVETDRTRTK